MQQLFLRRLLLGEEADIVDQEGIAIAKQLAKPVELVVMHRLHEAIGELLRGQEEERQSGNFRLKPAQIPSSRWVLPMPTGPCRTSGIGQSIGVSTGLRAEA